MSTTLNTLAIINNIQCQSMRVLYSSSSIVCSSNTMAMYMRSHTLGTVTSLTRSQVSQNMRRLPQAALPVRKRKELVYMAINARGGWYQNEVNMCILTKSSDTMNKTFCFAGAVATLETTTTKRPDSISRINIFINVLSNLNFKFPLQILGF